MPLQKVVVGVDVAEDILQRFHVFRAFDQVFGLDGVWRYPVFPPSGGDPGAVRQVACGGVEGAFYNSHIAFLILPLRHLHLGQIVFIGVAFERVRRALGDDVHQVHVRQFVEMCGQAGIAVLRLQPRAHAG